MKLFDFDKTEYEPEGVEEETLPSDGWLSSEDEELVERINITLEDDKIRWSDVKEFFTKYKFVVWLFSFLPIMHFVPNEFTSIRLSLLILQLFCFGIMCWIGWRDVFKMFYRR